MPDVDANPPKPPLVPQQANPLLPGSVQLPASHDLVRLFEDFFGDQLNRRMVRSAAQLPDDQADELAHRIDSLRWEISKFGRGTGLVQATVNEHLNVPNPNLDPAVRLVTARRCALYCPESLVSSTAFDWAHEVSNMHKRPPRAPLLQALREMNDLLPLHTCGALRFVPTARTFNVIVGDHQGAAPIDMIDVGSGWITFDPVVARRSVQPTAEFLADLASDGFDIEDPDVFFFEAFTAYHASESAVLRDLGVAEEDWRVQHVPPGAEKHFVTGMRRVIEESYSSSGHTATYDDVRSAAQLYALQFSIGSLALPEGITHFEHLREASRLVTGSRKEALGRALTSWTLPGVSELSAREVAALRSNEEVLVSFRTSLAELANLAPSFREDSFQGFDAAVREAAADMLTPIKQELQRRIRRARAKSLVAEWGTRLSTRLLLAGGAHIAPALGPAVGPVSGAAGTVAKRLSASGNEAYDVALKLIGQLTDST